MNHFCSSSQSVITHMLSESGTLDPNRILAGKLLKHKRIYIVMHSIIVMMLKQSNDSHGLTLIQQLSVLLLSLSN